MTDANDIDMDIADMLMEKPISFSIKGVQYMLHQPSLGAYHLILRQIKSLQLASDTIHLNPYTEMLKACQDKKNVVCRILTYYSFNKRDDFFNENKVGRRVEVFSELEAKDLASLLLTVMSWTDIEGYIKHFGIDKERTLRQRIATLQRKTSRTVNFGGRSVYGSLIDYACQRYGWTMDYVVWGISYANLQMLMADATSSAYLSEEEGKKLGIGGGDMQMIDADDPKNAALLRQMFNG